jgi:hypothetical protein
MTGHQPAADVERTSAPNGFIGQGTMIEQSRAMAEVQAAVVMARQFPRDELQAMRRMEIACGQQALADRANYRYPRGKDPETGKPLYVTGASVHLARELARCWGNVQYAVAELRRDYDQHHSEVLAYAWDLESNVRASAIFVVPHARDVTRDKVPTTMELPALRDVYENNANMGARRVREQIFAVLPVWYRERALTVVGKTLAGSSTVPLPERIANMISQWDAKYRLTTARLETKLGRLVRDWTEQDLALLRVVWESLGRGEVTVADEFPVETVTVAEVTGVTSPAEPVEQPDQPAPEPGQIVQSQQRKMRVQLRELGIDGRDRDAVLAKISMTLHALAKDNPQVQGRDIASSSELTYEEADAVISQFQREIQARWTATDAAEPPPEAE